ncbi:hypothetical protein R84B8_00243 [Treponema sp. R8-4-B8]
MKQPTEGANNAYIQERRQTTAAERLAKNTAANEELAKKEFPNETWVKIDNLKLKHVTMPKNATEILVAESRLPINKQEELDFLKEIKSAIILKDLGASVTLIPRLKRPDGNGFLPGPDAIVNGSLFEFKEVTGRMDKIGARFNYSRKQGNNVYIRVANLRLTKSHVMSYMARLINNPKYKGGYKGNLILTFGTDNEQKTYFFKISDLKKYICSGTQLVPEQIRKCLATSP